MSAATPTRVGADLYLEIATFLFDEADLLDSGRFEEWLELLADDVEYEMPLTLTRERSEQARIHPDGMQYFAEDAASLRLRVARLGTEYAWAEDPPTRTRHIVGNVRVSATDDPDEVEARSAFCVFASRVNWTRYDLYVGSRRDVLTRRDGSWKLRRRTLYLDQATLGSLGLSIFL